jgi:hypothetical protein
MNDLIPIHDPVPIPIRNLFDEMEAHLLGVQQPMLVIAALILSVQHLDKEAPAGTPDERQRWLIDRILALVNAAEKQSQEMAGALDDAMALLGQRDELLAGGREEPAEGEPDVVKQSVEEYAARFCSLGKAPMILLFSEDERKVLGSTPLAHLIAMLTAAQVGDKNALEQSLILARQLAEGARVRTWDEPPEETDDDDALDAPDEETTGDET